MSHFACEQCGVPQLDSESGYVSGCCHYPPQESFRDVSVVFEDGSQGTAFYKTGKWFRGLLEMARGIECHPVRWKR